MILLLLFVMIWYNDIIDDEIMIDDIRWRWKYWPDESDAWRYWLLLMMAYYYYLMIWYDWKAWWLLTGDINDIIIDVIIVWYWY